LWATYFVHIKIVHPFRISPKNVPPDAGTSGFAMPIGHGFGLYAAPYRSADGKFLNYGNHGVTTDGGEKTWVGMGSSD